MDNETLTVEIRSRLGTTGARALRRNGKIPGILYGHGSPPLPVALAARALEELLHKGGKTRLLTLRIDGRTGDTALVRDVQRDPVSRRVIHADLQRVSATETITAALPIVTVGDSPGVREGGVLEVVLHTIEVSGPANRIPEQIEVDVSQLGMHEHISAGELRLPPGFTLGTAPETTVASVMPSLTEAQAVPDLSGASPAATPTTEEGRGGGSTP
jgi:large subunit ribosomal protein L25